jgi:pantetheine-phosphate adenylyltransferase
MTTKACFPGSFDPFTKGHEDVVRRGLSLFDEIVIAVGVNTSKAPYFNLEKRLAHIQGLYSSEPRVKVKTFSGLTVTFCKENQCTHILRGLRDTKDFNYEQPIALLNREMENLETIFVLPAPELMAINASIIREIHKSGGKIDRYVTNVHQLV